jgi:flagellar assembly protein FliH
MLCRVIRGDTAGGVAPLGWQPPASDTRVENGAAASYRPDEGSLRLQVEERVRQAYLKGLQEGREAARMDHETQVQPLIDNLMQVLAAFDDFCANARRQSAEDIVSLAIAIARRILHRELTLDPESVRGLVNVALDRASKQELHRVRVHSNHVELIRELVARACSNQNIEVVADPAFRSGDLIFETERGGLDASIDSQLEEIRRGLADRLGD